MDRQFIRPVRRFFSSKARPPVLTLDSINQNLKDMEYAVRGLVPMTAEKIQAELTKNPGAYPFSEVLFCNIGNPQSVGQKHLSFYREVTSLCDYPALLESLEKDPSTVAAAGLPYDSYSIKRARECLTQMKNGTGAYSNSLGVISFREAVSKFIEKRDKACKVNPTPTADYSSDPNSIFLTNGASTAIQLLLTALINKPTAGLLIPVPQYPIYSALTRLLNGKFVGYYLSEENRWGLDMEELKRSVKEAKEKGIECKAIVIINPGNPIGNVLTYDDIVKVIQLCKDEGLVLMSDEVYQENIYDENRPFVSAKKVLKDLGPDYDCVELASFHSTSKGFIGECGKRGGYMELVNFDSEVVAQLVKLASSGLCGNLVGQLVTSLMVNPPTESDDSFQKYKTERDSVMGALNRKSKMVYEKLNAIPGVSCQPLDGAMYAFPNLTLSERFQKEAESKGRHPDVHYALSLLQKTGICAVPGSGFGQKEGTFHIRLTFLPDEEKLSKAMDDFAEHHLQIQ